MSMKLVIITSVVVALLVGAYFLSPQASAPATTTEGTLVPVDSEEKADAADLEENVMVQEEESTVVAEDTSPKEEEVAAPAPKPTPKPAPAPTPEPAPPLPYNALVIYNGSRFIPDEVTILEGGTVRFINTSETTKMWVASANHPTHTIYPIKSDEDCLGSSFDECEAIGAGESWDFTFERFGIWGYHNHMRAKDTGKIQVLRLEEYLKKI